jgi:predicted transcriptional regulator
VSLHIPPEIEQRVEALAQETKRDPQSLLTELLDDALESPVELPRDYDDYLRYRFERAMAAEARGEAFEISPRDLMARIRARVEKAI